ncbi:MAG TPA: hypothetical protein VMT72_10775 [Pseudolabrys sp.]|nr:hypothetical protein [Pseudolabrys sp.]
MFRLYALLACFFLAISVEPSRAAPQDSPGTIYIDGVACNLACQSYLAWSRQQLTGQAAPAAPRTARPSRVAKPVPKPKLQRVAKLPEPRPSIVAPSPAATENTPARTENAIAPARVEPTPAVAGGPPASRDEAKVSSDDKPAAVAAPDSNTPVAGKEPDQMTTGTTQDTAPMPEPAAKTNAEPSNPPPHDPPANTETAALAPQDGAGEMIAIVLVRPDIKSASDLANKIVAVDEAPAEYSIAEVRNAMVAAGATEVQLIENKTAALVRVIDGEVQAAVVSVMSSKAAGVWSAGLSGFNVLWIKLPPHSEKSKRG